MMSTSKIRYQLAVISFAVIFCTGASTYDEPEPKPPELNFLFRMLRMLSPHQYSTSGELIKMNLGPYALSIPRNYLFYSDDVDGGHQCGVSIEGLLKVEESESDLREFIVEPYLDQNKYDFESLGHPNSVRFLITLDSQGHMDRLKKKLNHDLRHSVKEKPLDDFISAAASRIMAEPGEIHRFAEFDDESSTLEGVRYSMFLSEFGVPVLLRCHDPESKKKINPFQVYFSCSYNVTFKSMNYRVNFSQKKEDQVLSVDRAIFRMIGNFYDVMPDDIQASEIKNEVKKCKKY